MDFRICVSPRRWDHILDHQEENVYGTVQSQVRVQRALIIHERGDVVEETTRGNLND